MIKKLSLLSFNDYQSQMAFLIIRNNSLLIKSGSRTKASLDLIEFIFKIEILRLLSQDVLQELTFPQQELINKLLSNGVI